MLQRRRELQSNKKIQVSKSSLSLWLHDMPLPEKRLRELRDHNVVRIERFSNTMRRKREDRWAEVRKHATKDIRTLNKESFLLLGFFIYWGEGEGGERQCLLVLQFQILIQPCFVSSYCGYKRSGVSKIALRVPHTLYADMDIRKELRYWSKVLDLPLTSFTKPYIKTSNRIRLSYKQKFTHTALVCATITRYIRICAYGARLYP